MYVTIMTLKCLTCGDGLKVMEHDRKEGTNRGTHTMTPSYFPDIESTFHNRHDNADCHSVTISRSTHMGEI